MIHVYRYDMAPPELQELTSQGGDEDWIVVFPAIMAADFLDGGTPRWVLSTDSCQEPVRIDQPNGDVIFVGCH